MQDERGGVSFFCSLVFQMVRLTGGRNHEEQAEEVKVMIGRIDRS